MLMRSVISCIASPIELRPGEGREGRLPQLLLLPNALLTPPPSHLLLRHHVHQFLIIIVILHTSS
jgi:hypothetical protein